MNIPEISEMLDDELNFKFSGEEGITLMKMAAVGLSPVDIALAMEFDRKRRRIFCLMAEIPESDVAQLIAAGRANGLATPQIKLHEAASAGNIEAIRELVKVQRRNEFLKFIKRIDDDEFS